jgi:hypothetical protein
MADVKDVDPDLQPLARRVPVEARANMSSFELAARCEHAAQLLGDAETARDDHQAGLLRAKAEKVLKALSSDAYTAEATRLDNDLAAAHKRGDDQACYRLMSEINILRSANPQVPGERILAAATAALVGHGNLRVPIPPPVKSRVFTRKRRS